MRMSLASSLENNGELVEAEQICRDVLARQQHVLPPDHPDTLYTLNALANVLYRLDRLDEAERVLTDLAARTDKVYGLDAYEPLVIHGSVAFILRERGKPDEAAAQFRDIIARAGRSLGDDNIATMRARSNLAFTLVDQGKLDEAEAIYRAEIPRWRRVRGELHAETMVQLRGLGELLEKANRLPEAETVYAELFTSAERSQDDPKQIARNLAPLGLVRAKLNKFAEAEPALRTALLKMIDAGDVKDLRVWQLYEALIQSNEKLGKPEEAARLRAELQRIRPNLTTTTAPGK
jgi:tetratricopeptide (TPR) repeat protein